MSELKEKVKEQLVEDESILSMYLPKIKKYISLTKDGKPVIRPSYASISNKCKILLYAIGKRLSYEAELIDSPEIPNDTVYKIVDITKSGARDILSDLRDERLLYSETRGKHSIYMETVPRALEFIENEVDDDE